MRHQPILVASTLLAACVLAAACETVRDTDSARNDSLGAQIDAVAEGFLVRRPVPGMAICAMRSGSVLYEGYYGLANVATEVPVSRATLFDLGSIKKQVTAAAIVRLQERGKLGLDDPLTRWLPQFPLKVPVIRLRHMLNQMSGLPDESEMTGPIVLDFEPGTSWAYSNANFDILDNVVEAADGRPFARYLTEELAAPLHLETLAMCDEDATTGPSNAQGYTTQDGAVVPVEEPCWFLGNALDLATWMDALMRDRVLSNAGVRAMTTPAKLADGSERPYGFGLDLRPYRGFLKIWHTGHVGGYSSALAYYPDQELTIAVLANSGALYDPESVEMGVARVVLGLPDPEPHEIAMDEEDIERFSGVFDARSVWFRFGPSEDGRRLFMTMQGPAEDSWEYVSLEMVRVGDNELVAREAPEAVRAHFQEDEDSGYSPHLQLDMVGIRWDGVRR